MSVVSVRSMDEITLYDVEMKIRAKHLSVGMSRLPIAVAIATLIGSLTVFAKVEGTYVLSNDQDDNSPFDPKQTTLAINVDDEGKYSATLTSGFGAVNNSDNVEVTDDEFEASFVLSTSQGEFTVTNAGKVKNGSLSGTLSGTLSEEGDEIKVNFTGKLKEENEPDSDKEAAEAE